jgi:hypothetical protein
MTVSKEGTAASIVIDDVIDGDRCRIANDHRVELLTRRSRSAVLSIS